jgi:hypothetical protein
MKFIIAIINVANYVKPIKVKIRHLTVLFPLHRFQGSNPPRISSKSNRLLFEFGLNWTFHLFLSAESGIVYYFIETQIRYASYYYHKKNFEQEAYFRD